MSTSVERADNVAVMSPTLSQVFCQPKTAGKEIERETEDHVMVFLRYK